MDLLLQQLVVAQRKETERDAAAVFLAAWWGRQILRERA